MKKLILNRVLCLVVCWLCEFVAFTVDLFEGEHTKGEISYGISASVLFSLGLIMFWLFEGIYNQIQIRSNTKQGD